MAGYWFPVQYLAIHDNDGQFATMAKQLGAENARLSAMMEYPELAGTLVASAALPEDYEKEFPLVGLARIRRGATFDRRAARLAFLAAPALVAMATAVAASGFLDLFIDRLSDDAGSGQTRLIMLQFFDIIPPRDILLGPDPAWVKSLQVQEGVELGIESFFVGFVLAHGALMAGMFFVGMFAFCWQIARRTLPGTWLTLMFYFVVASLSVSLSVKTIAFAIFVAMTLSIMRRGGEEYAA
jgi:hypothetical protein